MPNLTSKIRTFLTRFAIGAAVALIIAVIRLFLWSQEAAAWAGALGTVSAILFAYASGTAKERRDTDRLTQTAKTIAVQIVAAIHSASVDVSDPDRMNDFRELGYPIYVFNDASEALTRFPLHELNDIAMQSALRLLHMQLRAAHLRMEFTMRRVRSGLDATPELVKDFNDRYADALAILADVDQELLTSFDPPQED